MPICRLQRIVCHDQNEVLDEPYITINGKRVWDATKVKAGQTREINQDHQFISRAVVKLYEHDLGRGNWFDPDDFLGQQEITAAYIDKGELEFHFIGAGAHYSIWIVVLADA